MDSSLKSDFKLLVASESIREKYRYDESQIYLTTFIASFGYCNKLTGFDMAYAVDAILENNVSWIFWKDFGANRIIKLDKLYRMTRRTCRTSSSRHLIA